jgi:hypothetical protein
MVSLSNHFEIALPFYFSAISSPIWIPACTCAACTGYAGTGVDFEKTTIS